MSAQDDYPIALSALAWHSQWTKMCAEIDALRDQSTMLAAEALKRTQSDLPAVDVVVDAALEAITSHITPDMKSWWVSWYSADDPSMLELHSPWWVSGYDSDDMPIFVAAIRAVDEIGVWEVVRNAYDHPPSADVRERFVQPIEQIEDSQVWPFGDRFPQAEWMIWEPDKGITCACYKCLKQRGVV